jgi:hypothetical protein
MRIIKISLLLFCVNQAEAMGARVPQADELINASMTGNCDAIVKYKEAGGDLNATVTNRSALMAAVLQGHEKAAQLLLQLGASPDIQDQTGATILFYDRCSPQVFKAALEAQANPNIQSESGVTPLIRLVSYGSSTGYSRCYRIALLIKYGAKIDIKDNHGKTARDCAANSWLEKYLIMNAKELEKEIASFR